MTATVKPTTVRIDENLKARANEILGSVGLSYNTYVVMATHQLGIPFEIVPAGEVPNDETRRALIVAEAKEMGLIADDARAFDDVDKLMAFLDEE